MATEAEVPFKVNIIKNDIPGKLKDLAIKKVAACITEKMIEKDIATALKQYLDKDGDTPSWHCVIGRNFGSSVTHETKYLLFFQIGVYHVLLFKSAT